MSDAEGPPTKKQKTEEEEEGGTCPLGHDHDHDHDHDHEEDMKVLEPVREVIAKAAADGRELPEIPVTVLSGFLGAGKSTLLKHVLENRKGLKVAVLVNDMGEVNIDAEMVRDGGLVKGTEEVVALTNGCICCTLREDLFKEISRVANSGEFEYILIESSGISEPLPVAETFTFEDDEGVSLMKIAQLDTMVTVVDGPKFFTELHTVQTLKDRGWHTAPEDDRKVAHLLCDQVEFSDVILLNKCDLLEKDSQDKVESLLKQLNPTAIVIRTEHSKIDPKLILGCKRFSMEEAEKNPQWLKEARTGEHVPETEEYGISSFTFHSTRPFHAGRFELAIEKMLGADEGKGAEGRSPLSAVVRAKGTLFMATEWGWDGAANGSLAGSQFCIKPESHWNRVLKDDGEMDEDEEKELSPEDAEKMAREPWGDRESTFVIIGQDMDQMAVQKELEACLCTESEAEGGQEQWAKLPDPFEEYFQIEIEGEEEEEEEGEEGEKAQEEGEAKEE